MAQQSNYNKPPSSPRKQGFFIDGEWQKAEDREIHVRKSPAHDVPVSHIPQATQADLNKAVASARRAFEETDGWARCHSNERAKVLIETARLIRQRESEIAYWETLENGKPINQAKVEVAATSSMFEYAAGVARSLHGDSFNNLGQDLFGTVTREPVGVVGLITPWNFPFLILCERVPFILASGCTIVAKPSEMTSMTTLLLAEVLADAGLPKGCFNVVTGSGSDIGQKLVEHLDIDMVSFTGSTKVGKKCIDAAKGNFKKLALELGGKNPQIVFADANLEDAADGVAFGMCFNSGQCCVSGSRLLIEKSVSTKFIALLKDKLSKVRVGDPLHATTQLGAITTEVQCKSIMRHIEQGKKEGAHLVCGGNVVRTTTGQFIEPTVFSQVTSTMDIARKEIFGPVLCITEFENVGEAIRRANDSQYGLAASVWTKNIDKAMVIARSVRAGRFWVNTTLAGGCELPLGGFKQSGWGRETGVYGVEEYTQLKSIHTHIGERTRWIS